MILLSVAVNRLLNAVERATSAVKADEDDHFYGAWAGGSAAEGGHPARGMKDTAPAHVRSFESDIRGKDSRVEWAQVWDKDGNPIYAEPVKGTAGRVRFRNSANTQQRWRGGTLTHLHPGEGEGELTLSVEDCASHFDNQLAVTRAFGQDGSWMEITNDGYPYNGTAFKMRFRMELDRLAPPKSAFREVSKEEFAKAAREYHAAYRQAIITTARVLGERNGGTVGIRYGKG